MVVRDSRRSQFQNQGQWLDKLSQYFSWLSREESNVAYTKGGSNGQSILPFKGGRTDIGRQKQPVRRMVRQFLFGTAILQKEEFPTWVNIQVY